MSNVPYVMIGEDGRVRSYAESLTHAADVARDLPGSSFVYELVAKIDATHEVVVSVTDLREQQRKQKEPDPYEPDWSKVHVLYNFAATDMDGSLWVYEYEPIAYFDDAWGCSKCYHNLERLCDVTNNPDWKSSLRVRPQS